MTHWTRLALPLALPVLLCVTPAHAQTGSTLTVHVSSAANGEPVAEASVALVGTTHTARTDASGSARLTGLEAGTWRLQVRAMGFAEHASMVTIQIENADVFVQLQPTAQRLDTVTARADAPASPWLNEFDERRRRGTGRYVTGEELRAQHGSDLGSILMSRIPGLRQNGRGQIISTRGQDNLRGGPSCVVAVFIDGIRVPTDNPGEMQLALIGGIEYYTPGTVPVQYKTGGRGGSCGTLLLWTGP